MTLNLGKFLPSLFLTSAFAWAITGVFHHADSIKKLSITNLFNERPAERERVITDFSCRNRIGDAAFESIVATKNGGEIYVTDVLGRRLLELYFRDGTLPRELLLPAEPTGLAISPDEKSLLATCGDPVNGLIVVDRNSFQIIKTVPTGAGACCPVVGLDGRCAYVMDRFCNRISLIALPDGTLLNRANAGREPIAAVLTPDGALLVVANHLPNGPSNMEMSPLGLPLYNNEGATVRLIDAVDLSTVAVLPLPRGATGVRGVCVSPDGKYAFVCHVLANYANTTFVALRGWINKNALSVVDLQKREILCAVVLDEMNRGAANPWGVACSPDGSHLLVTHAGTHELSVVSVPEWIERLTRLPEHGRLSMPEYEKPQSGNYGSYPKSELTRTNVARDLTFMKKYQKRVELKGLGPRGVVAVGNDAYVADYFTGSVERVTLSSERPKAETVYAVSPERPTMERWGEFLFNDAILCHEGWQSCASCHPDGRMDGLNWDLLNDGRGNPKNTKSLLLSHQTPPVMNSGVRPNAETAVRSGLKYILFANRSEEEAKAVDAYLKSLKPLGGSSRLDESLCSVAQRGKKLFLSRETGCSNCHNGECYTDLKSYNVGIEDRFDERDAFDTPSLIELWRTAPYLHDGRAATVEDVLTIHNLQNRHGKTAQLSKPQIYDLAAFLKSL